MIHGQTKKKHQPTPAELERSQELSHRVNLALDHFLKLRHAQLTVEDPIQATTGLLKLCPQIPTIYNYRMQLILASKKDMSQEQYHKLLTNNILLTSKLLRENPKSYTIWNFRQALVLQHSGEFLQQCLTSELALCQQMHNADQRNFHVWNYRNWLHQVKPDINRELAYVDSKLGQNPSNFSAYHFKIKLLTDKYRGVSTSKTRQIFSLPEEIYRKELDQIKQIIYIDGKEFGPWRYYEWLISLQKPIQLLTIQPSTTDPHQLILTFNKAVSSPAACLGYGQNQPGFSIRWSLKMQSPQVVFKGNCKGEVEIEGQFGGKLVLECEFKREGGQLRRVDGEMPELGRELLKREMEFLEQIEDNPGWKERMLQLIKN